MKTIPLLSCLALICASCTHNQDAVVTVIQTPSNRVFHPNLNAQSIGLAFDLMDDNPSAQYPSKLDDASSKWYSTNLYALPLPKYSPTNYLYLINIGSNRFEFVSRNNAKPLFSYDNDLCIYARWIELEHTLLTTTPTGEYYMQVFPTNGPVVQGQVNRSLK